MKKTLFAIILAAGLSAVAGPTHYSKLGIVTAARKLGRLDAMNAWIQQAGYWNEWLACQVFRDDYEGFDAITNAVVASGLATGAEITAVLEASKVESETDRLRAMVESDKGLREKYHGGRIGQYVLPDGAGRLIRVDLYADSTVWTNGMTYGVNPLLDPEAMAKAIAEAKAKAEAERERVQAAWETANLPPDLAELRRKQREAERRRREEEL